MEVTYLKAYRSFAKDYLDNTRFGDEQPSNNTEHGLGLLRHVSDDLDGELIKAMCLADSNVGLEEYIQHHIKELYEDLPY